MKGTLFFAVRSSLRNPRMALSLMIALALAVGLAVSTVLYVGASSRSLTLAALRPVAVDLVAHGTTDRIIPEEVAAQYRSQPSVQTAEPLIAADFVSVKREDGASQTGTGKLFAVTENFATQFPFVATSEGSFITDGVLLSLSTVAQLGLKPGDSVLIATSAGTSAFRYAGTLDTAAAEPLFSSGDANFEGEFAIVPDIVIMSISAYRNSAIALQPGSVQGKAPLDPQVYLKLDENLFSGTPGATQKRVRAVALGLERLHTGQIKITNNDDSALTRARRDVISADAIFIFLGIPGITVAVLLALGVTRVFQDENRREIGLLRARGAAPKQILTIAAINSAFVGLAGSVAGTAMGWIVASSVGGVGTITAEDAARVAPFALVFGIALTVGGLMLPINANLRNEVTSERRQVSRLSARPAWQRYHLDYIALGLAGILLLITYIVGGFRPTDAEGQSISLAFYVFLGPLFLWIGLTLVAQRLLASVMPRVLLVAGNLMRLRGFAAIGAKDLIRRPVVATTATTVLALTIAFAFSVIAFTHTYHRERERDTRYVVGSDIRVTVSSAGLVAPERLEPALWQPGVVAYSGFARETNALVGAQRQTVYGIDVPSFRDTAYLPDTFFVSGSAARDLDALAATPNGVLVSREEAALFNIQKGDPLTIRLPAVGAPGSYKDVTLETVGITTHFPTSSQDSDFIVNREIIQSSRSSPRSDVYLVRTSAPRAELRAISAVIADSMPPGAVVRVLNLDTAAKVDESTLASLNVSGLGAIQRWYCYALAGGALLIFLFTLLAQREREFSTMRALGTSLGQVRRMISVQAAYVTLTGVLVGSLVGAVMGYVLVKCLAIIFTIPVSAPAYLSNELGLLYAGALIGALLSILIAMSAMGRSRIATVLREE